MPSTSASLFPFLVAIAILNLPTTLTDVTYANICRFLYRMGEILYKHSRSDLQGIEGRRIAVNDIPILSNLYHPQSQTEMRYVGKSEAAEALTYMLQQAHWTSVVKEWPMTETYCAWKQDHPTPQQLNPGDPDYTPFEESVKRLQHMAHRAVFDQVVLLGCNFLAPRGDDIPHRVEVYAFLVEAGSMMQQRRSPKQFMAIFHDMTLGDAIFNWKEIVRACQQVYRTEGVKDNDFKYRACKALHVAKIDSTWWHHDTY